MELQPLPAAVRANTPSVAGGTQQVGADRFGSVILKLCIFKQWFWFCGITHSRQLTISILREQKGKSPCDGEGELQSLHFSSFILCSFSRNTIITAHTNQFCLGVIVSSVLWPSADESLCTFRGDGHCSLVLLKAGMDLARLMLAPLSHGHQLSAFLYLIEMHKNALSNLTKLSTNYKALFAISYVISFWKLSCFLSLWMCIQSRQICRHTIRSWFWKEVNKLHWLEKGFLLPFYYDVHTTCYKFFTLHFYHKDKWNCQSCSHFLLMAIQK